MAKTTNNTTRDETEAEFAGTLQLLLDRCEASVLRAKKLELELKNAKVSRERAAARARELETELGVRTEASNKKIESLSPPRLLEAATEVLRTLPICAPSTRLLLFARSATARAWTGWSPCSARQSRPQATPSPSTTTGSTCRAPPRKINFFYEFHELGVVSLKLSGILADS